MLRADQQQFCRSCGIVLTEENSYPNRAKGRRQSACKSCGSKYTKAWLARNREQERERAKTYYAKNRDRLRLVYDRSRVIRKYGITPEQIEAMRVAQNGVCPICRKRPSRCVDHDHETGETRALLCTHCNTVLGLMQEQPEWLQRAAAYLKIWKGATVMDNQSDLVEIVAELKQVLCVKG